MTPIRRRFPVTLYSHGLFSCHLNSRDIAWLNVIIGILTTYVTGFTSKYTKNINILKKCFKVFSPRFFLLLRSG